MSYKWIAVLGCALLVGCQARTNVSATGNTPAQFTHVFLTVNQVWFNTSATAAASDTSWQKFTLTTPTSIDLAALTNGTLNEFATALKVPAGTYNQVMLILADSTDALTASAEALSAVTNDEVDYVDSLDDPHTVPLAILNAAQGITISTSLTVAAAATSIASAVGGGSTIGTPSSDSTSSTVTTTTTTSSATISSPTVTTTATIIDFDGTRDLLPISLGGQPAYALNPHLHLYDAKYSGSIQGSVTLTNVSTLTPAGFADVQVAAEGMSSDGTRHVVVKTTRVDANGNFALYPLSTADSAASTYDVVIHGPSIETVIIKGVPIATGAPGVAAVQLGTLTLTSATPFLVNFNTSSPANPTSSLVGFYQTLPASSEEPYLIETRAVDPISGLFASDQSLSGGNVQYGSYVSGGTISLTSVNPSQGAATYAVGAINPAYGTAALGTTVKSPGNTTTVALFTMSAPPAPTGSAANGISGTISVASVGTYNAAELFLTYQGALVATAPLTSYLGQGQSTLSLTAVAPGGSTDTVYAPGVYNAEVWAWNTSNPTGTLSRIPSASSIDMSAGNASGVSLQVQ